MSNISSGGKIALAGVLMLFALSLLLLIAEVLRSDDLRPAQKLAWSLGLIFGNFFTVVIYFAQGRTGRLGRLSSVLMSAGIVLAIGIIAALVIRL